MNDVELLPPQFKLLSWMVETERSQPPEKQYKGFKTMILPISADADIEMISRATDRARKRCDLPHLRVLENSGFVGTQPLPGGFLMTHIMLTPAGFSYYDAAHELPEGLAQEKRNLVDTKVSQAYPEAVGHLKNAHDALWVKQPGDNWSVVGHNCWDALDAFAKAIYRPEYAPREREQPTDDQFKNKLTFTVSANTNEEELQQLLIALTNKTVDYAYRARRHDKQTTQAEAKRCVLYTYLLISEIYELLNPLV